MLSNDLQKILMYLDLDSSDFYIRLEQKIHEQKVSYNGKF